MNLTPCVPLRDVILADYRTAFVFQQYGLDFCNGKGGGTIQGACEEKGVNPVPLLADLNAVLHTIDSEDHQMRTWDADFLVDYIVQNHHRYIRATFPIILQRSLKVARQHGDREERLLEIAKIFTLVASDLQNHLAKEEELLFPYIKALAAAARDEGPLPRSSFGSIRALLRGLENEHEEAEDWMHVIRDLTDNYTVRDDQCISCHVLFKELEEFEQDMRRHLHIETKILFPKVLALEARFKRNLHTLP